ncbi:efflux RND transporter periplasmic adaptor subunit [Photobacterium sp. OFAV2-7]|uniref:efflux RND transporter periplasmic adaptor subunit n=1 Tax=Photobacterium sp. OFAV2-7 TaxID=2917748 RepID=UPI001EF64104|nr:efflux RND transporter periplasmic adaptor subunit [Photobacterium sp. OFAV2-7]MCG7584339.1 efflux RND transporter periplasmic adaptor subunit [Photobacterium sp. OFAV2-7]
MQKKKPTYKAWLLVVSSLGLVTGGLGYYKYNEIKTAIDMAESFPEHYEVVDAATVKVAEHALTVSVLGTATSPLQTELFTELSGKVAFVGIKPGESAMQGDLLFQLDISEEQARIKSAKARERHATSVYQRYKKLLAKNAISQEQFDQAYADLIVIQSEIEVLQATIAQKTVIAPFNGVMGIHDITLGDYVSANQMLSNFVGVTDTVWVEFSVPQFYPELRVGSQVRVRNIDALGTSSFQLAEVSAKDTQISNTTRSLKYRAEVSRMLAQYTPNTPLEVLIPISDNVTVYQVPVTSVNQDLYGSYVMKLVPQEYEPGAYRATRLPVQVISETDEFKLINQGLQEGEKIAAAGAFKLYEGLLVRTREERSHSNSPLVAATGDQ